MIAASIGHAVSAGFRSQVQDYVKASYPSRASVKVVGGYVADDPRPTRQKAREYDSYIRKIRAGGVAQPELDKAWPLGEALAALSRKRWVGPVLMLFACGYYGHVADLLINVSDSYLPRKRRIEMAQALPTVIFGSDAEPATAAESRERLRRSAMPGLNDLLAQRAGHREAAMPAEERPDRMVWSLDLNAYTAFLTGWDRIVKGGLDMTNPAIATSQFITERAIYPVDDRNRIVSALIAENLLRSSQPKGRV